MPSKKQIVQPIWKYAIVFRLKILQTCLVRTWHLHTFADIRRRSEKAHPGAALFLYCAFMTSRSYSYKISASFGQKSPEKNADEGLPQLGTALHARCGEKEMLNITCFFHGFWWARSILVNFLLLFALEYKYYLCEMLHFF